MCPHIIKGSGRKIKENGSDIKGNGFRLKPGLQLLALFGFSCIGGVTVLSVFLSIYCTVFFFKGQCP